MSTFFQFLAEQGGVLLATATCLLAVGCVGVSLQRSPIHMQRAGEVAILGVLAALVLACVPLPRYRLLDFWPADSVAQNSVRPTEQVAIPPPVFDAQDEAVLAEVMVEEEVPLMRSDVLPPDIRTAAEDGGASVPVLPKVPVLPDVPEPATAVEGEPLPSTEVVQRPAEADRATATLGRSASVAPAVDVRYPLAIAYVAGALGCFVWLAFGRVLLVRMVWSARPAEPWLREVYHRLPFGRRRRPRLLISDRCTRALSFGIWRPAIVLPGDACRTDRVEALRYVLSHELAHVRQRDGWGHLLFNAAFPLLYFHPLYWWLRSRAYLAAELIADDLAAGRRTKESYVEALVALAKRGGRVQLAYSISPQILGSRSQFYRRMQMLLDRETRLERRCSPLWRVIYPAACLLAVVLVAGAAGVRPAEAQSEEVLPPADPAAEKSPAVEDTTELIAIPDLPVESEAPVLIEPEPVLAPPDVGEKKIERATMLTERRLRAQLQELEASVRSLSKMVESLRKQQAGRDFRRTGDPVLRADVYGPKLVVSQAEPRTSGYTIPKGYRVVTVNVDVDSARKVKPGDFVNVATWKSNFPDIMVFAVPGEPAADGRRHPSGRPRATVSLLVTPAEAKKLAQVSEERGISLQDPKRLPQPSDAPVITPKSSEPRPGPLKPKPTPLLSTFQSETFRDTRPASTRQVASPLGPLADRRAPQGTRLDLVRLATSYADVVGELEIAKLELEGRKNVASISPTAIPKKEMAIAEIKLKTAQRKLTLLSDIAKSALMATEAEMAAAMKRLDWLKTNGPNDHPAVETSKSELIRAQSRLEILKSILGSAGR